MIILTEKAAFERLIEGFRMSVDGARSLAHHQPEKAHMWNKMAETYAVAQQAAWKLMDEAAAKYKGTPMQ
jgi:hypothetical protein